MCRVPRTDGAWTEFNGGDGVALVQEPGNVGRFAGQGDQHSLARGAQEVGCVFQNVSVDGILMEASSSMGEEAAEAVQKAADMMGMKGPGSK